jgi:FHA domain
MAAGDSAHTLRVSQRNGMTDNTSQRRFADACGMLGIVRLIVTNTDTGAQSKHDLTVPFSLIGRDPACDVQLPDPGISARHAYLQILQGRMLFFDLGSRTGIRFPGGLRKEGVLRESDSLLIGPFKIQLSRAPAYRLPKSEYVDESFENSAVEDAHVLLRNAHSRSNKKLAMRRLHERVTLLGRHHRCHIKLSHESVGRIHAAIIRTDAGDWLVNLRPDRSTLLNGKPVNQPSVAIVESDQLTLGRFRMTVVNGSIPADESSLIRHAESGNVASNAAAKRPQTPSGPGGGVQANAPLNSLIPSERSASGGRQVDEGVLVSLIHEFGHMQRQILDHSHQQTLMVAQLLRAMHQTHDSAIHEQLARLQAVTDELSLLQQRRIAVSSVQPETPGIAQDVEFQPKSAPDPPGPLTGNEDVSVPVIEDPPDDFGKKRRSPSEEYDPVAAYDRLTSRIHDLERERSSGWQRIMNLLGVGETVN